MDKFTKNNPLVVLNIGTKILIKDVMDQYMRSLGEVKTYYSSKLASAIASFHEKSPDIIFCEYTFPEGGALEFVRAIGGLDYALGKYFVLAADESDEKMENLALELQADEILVKPFSTSDVSLIVERSVEKKAAVKPDLAAALGPAKQAWLENRHQEAEALFMNLIKEHSSELPALFVAADFFLARGNFEKVRNICAYLLSKMPNSAKALYLSALAAKGLGEFETALELMKKASSFSPLNYLRDKELAEIHIGLAEESISNAIKYNSEQPSLILLRAQFYIIRKNYGALIKYLENKRAYLKDSDLKEAESLLSFAKKITGVR
ncbi:MAG: hypothetical protein M9962_05110 [Oligoflexia bacterium]|nr:hypothetical protein [Oligoflexia bacterium]